MNVFSFIKKEAKVPDNYGIKVYYIDGKEEEFEVANRRLHNGVYEFVTKEDVWNIIPVSAIKRIEYDKRYSQVIAEYERLAKEKEEADKPK